MSLPATAPLLVELLVEELPPKALKALGSAFAEAISASLRAQDLAVAGTRVTPYSTPRRLAVLIEGVVEQAAGRAMSIKLMPSSVGFAANGEPTQALLKKLATVGADASAAARLERRVDGKAETLYLETAVAGVTLVEGLQRALDQAIARLPIPKLMQYQLADGWTSVSFVRPAHGLVALHGDVVVKVRALGLEAGRVTRGHRFMAPRREVRIERAEQYADTLRRVGVHASFAERREEIVRQLQRSDGLVAMHDDALLDEVTGLVELPFAVECRFEKEFLSVPPECLILTMKVNQRYFPLHDASGSLTERFIVISNIRAADMSRVVEGNERVVRPRLADAKFFFDQDRRRTLASRLPALDKVVYHAKLGSQGERTMRVRSIAGRIAAEAFPDEKLGNDVDRAAELAKADLLTDMVGEFPELQGTMGGYYARHDGESAAVAEAVEDHYKPRFAGDALPRNKVGVVVALADKLEVLVGLFGIGQLPTGDKDPFALRRQALGVIRMLIDVPVPIGLERLVALAVPVFGAAIQDPTEALLAFIHERLAGSLREQGFSAQEVDAVLSRPPAQLAELRSRLDAVRAFAALPEAASLAAANKRVGNILKKSSDEASRHVRSNLLVEPAEQALHGALLKVESIAGLAFDQGDYTASLQALAALRAPVDAFFDVVMVNADDLALRGNRLGLLVKLHAAMNRVADLSKLAG